METGERRPGRARDRGGRSSLGPLFVSLGAAALLVFSIVGLESGCGASSSTSPPSLRIRFAAAPGISFEAGATQTLSVRVVEAGSGLTDAAYRGTVRFSSTDPTAQLPPDYAFKASDAGLHDFSGFVLNTLGAQTLQAFDVGTPSVDGSLSVVVTSAASESMLLTLSAPDVDSGQVFEARVSIQDAAGSPVTLFGGTVTFSSSDPRAQLPAPYAFTPADAGSHLFFLSLATSGTQQVCAFSGRLSQCAWVNVVEGAATTLTVIPASPSAAAGVSFTVEVRLSDASGNPANGTVVLISSDTRALLPGPYLLGPSDAGSHTFAATLLAAGLQTVCAVEGSLTGCASVQVESAPAASIRLVLNPSAATAGVSVTAAVTFYDVFFNPAGGFTGTVAFSSTDPQARLPAPYAFTPLDGGSHLFGVTPETAGVRQVCASSDSMQACVGLTVAAGAATRLALLGLTPCVPTGSAQTATVEVLDPYGNVVTPWTGTLAFSSSDGAATLPPPYSMTSSDGSVHAFSNGVLIATPGPVTVAVADVGGGLAPAVVSTSAGGVAVKVVDRSSGLPLSGAFVLVGSAPGDPFAQNSGWTDASGRVFFVSSVACTAPIASLTAGATGYAYLTLENPSSRTEVLPLTSSQGTGPYTIGNTNGTLADATDPNPPAAFPAMPATAACDGTYQYAFVSPSLSARALLGFNPARVTTDAPFDQIATSVACSCLGCGSLCPQQVHSLPSTLLYPRQDELLLGCKPPEKLEYFVTPPGSGAYHVWGLGGSVSESVLATLRPSLLLESAQVWALGVTRSVPLAGGDVTRQALDLDRSLPQSLTFQLSNTPAGLVAAVLASAVLTSAPATQTAPYLLAGIAATSSTPPQVLSAAVAAATGSLSDLEFRPSVVVSDVDGTSSNPKGYSATVTSQAVVPPATVTFSSFFSIPALSTGAATYQWSPVASTTSPSADLSLVTLSYPVYVDRGGVSFGVEKKAWELWAPGSATGVALPQLPAGAPKVPARGATSYDFRLEVFGLPGVSGFDPGASPDFSIPETRSGAEAGSKISVPGSIPGL